MTVNPGKASAAIADVVDYAVMDADVHESLLHKHLVWESLLFDNVSKICSDSYIDKVYMLVKDVKGYWSNINVSPHAETMFLRRFRTNWEAPDTVYDAWIPRLGWERSWLPSTEHSLP